MKRVKLYVCEVCGTKTAFIEKHHKNINPEDNRSENVIMVCHDCHVDDHFMCRKENRVDPKRWYRGVTNSMRAKIRDSSDELSDNLIGRRLCRGYELIDDSDR